MNRAELAVEYKHDHNNCCQAVLLAYADRSGLDEETLRRIGAAFGSGMGNMEGNCGALCGAQMILGLESEKRPLHADAAALLESFRAKTGAIRCADLKGIGTGTVLCPCDDCVRSAVLALEEILG